MRSPYSVDLEKVVEGQRDFGGADLTSFLSLTILIGHSKITF